MDRHTPEQRSKNMKAIRSSGTKIEVLMGKALWSSGLRYRKNNKTIFGKPDFTFKKYKVAIFCDSEFFHGKDWQIQKQRLTKEFWLNKIEKNIARDNLVNETLKKQGWTVIRFWGEEIKKNLSNCLRGILSAKLSAYYDPACCSTANTL